MKRWAALLALFLLLIVVLADTGRLGLLALVYQFPYGDKIGHFVLFGLLSLLVNLAVLETTRAGDRLAHVGRASLVLAALIGIEEWSQRFFPTRRSSPLDLAASYAGVALCAWLALRIRRAREPSAQHPA